MASNIVLIGMPGSGKSTVGVILAKRVMKDFLDTDVLIQNMQGKALQDIVNRDGYLALRDIEEKALLGVHVRNHVIATGGSAVYSEQAMRHLKTDGLVVFLDVELETLEARIPDFSTRGLAKRPNQSFAELFEERNSLYRKYADLTVKCDALTPEAVCEEIKQAIT